MGHIRSGTYTEWTDTEWDTYGEGHGVGHTSRATHTEGNTRSETYFERDIRVWHTRSGISGWDKVGHKGYRGGTHGIGTHRVRYRSGTRERHTE